MQFTKTNHDTEQNPCFLILTHLSQLYPQTVYLALKARLNPYINPHTGRSPPGFDFLCNKLMDQD